MGFLIAEVMKPLVSVSQICARGNRVVFDGANSFIEHKATGAKTRLRESKGVYVIDVKPVDKTDCSSLGFVGQGAWRARRIP